LHRAHYPAVLQLAFMLLQDVQDAEDATQDAFIYAFAHLDRYDVRRARFVTWLKVIVTSRCRDLQRRRRRKVLSLQALVERGREPVDDTAGHRPDVALELVGVQQVVWQALEKIPSKARQALILRYFGEMSYSEVAEALDCPVSTAKSRVAYALQKLAGLLERERGDRP
jgi:RNA polymerase sigma-70 factor (ECF subfamily)